LDVNVDQWCGGDEEAGIVSDLGLEAMTAQCQTGEANLGAFAKIAVGVDAVDLHPQAVTFLKWRRQQQ
jgi:hypothetical protein